MIKREQLNIRDPFILPFENKYYLYKSNYDADEVLGFDVYVSDDLENFDGPFKVFRRSDDFWGTKDFWAPEVHYYNGSFYLFATFNAEDKKRGTQILKSSSPFGPFVEHSDCAVTPHDMMCLDGTLYVNSKGTPYIVFCNEWTEVVNGRMYYAELDGELKKIVGEPKLMFTAQDYPSVRAISRGGYVTDGPFLYRCKNGDLVMIWSSFGEKGYFQGVLKSDNGEIDGKWIEQKPLFEENGGHGMLFTDFDGKLKLSLHAPNSPRGTERLNLYNLEDVNGTLSVLK